MLTTDKNMLAELATHVTDLLKLEALIEDPITGAIQLNTDLYTHIGKEPPATTGINAQRAKALAVVYQKLWPPKILSGGRPIRQGPLALTKKLTVFMNKHPKVTDAEILNATERYLAMKAKDQFKFVVSSDYFIEKSGGSLLESFITNPEAGAKEMEVKKSLNQRFI